MKSSRAYDKAAKAAYEAGDAAHARDIGQLHRLAASQHRIAAEHAYQGGDEAKEKEHRNHAEMHSRAAYGALADKHPDTGKGGEELTGSQIHLGATAKGEFKAGKNPPSFVADEAKWDAAKTAASKSYSMDDDAFWPVVTSIYQSSGGATKHEAKARLAAARLGALSARRMEGNTALMASIKDGGYSLTDLQERVARAYDEEYSDDDSEYAYCPYSCDIIAPQHEAGETWQAVVNDEGCLYQVDFTIGDNGEVKLDSEPKEVERDNDYKFVGDLETEAKRADAAAGIQPLEAGAPMGNQNAAKHKAAAEALQKSFDKDKSLRAPEGVEFGGVRKEDGPDGEHYVHIDQDRSIRHPDEYGGHSNPRIADKIAKANAFDDKVYGHISKIEKEHGVKFHIHASRASANGIEASDFKGNQHQSAQDVADEHSAAARVASRTANKASKEAKDEDKPGQDAAASAHRAAEAAHVTAEAKQRSAGNDDEADAHKAAAEKHAKAALDHGEKMANTQLRTGEAKEAKAAKKPAAEAPYEIACHCAGANPMRNWLQVQAQAAGGKAAVPTVDNIIMYMPAGTHSITPSQDGEPVDVTVLVDPEASDKIEAQRQLLDKAGKRPFFSVQHDTEIAAFWPEQFFWGERVDATGRLAEGIWVRGEWSKDGREAVEGKSFRTFSPTFFVDAVRNSVERPARVVCNEGARANMGALENDPAFQAMSPLWCRASGGKSKSTPDEAKALVRACHEELRATNPTLAAVCARLREQHKVRLSETEVSAMLVD